MGWILILIYFTEVDDVWCHDYLEISDKVFCGTITPASLVIGFNVVTLTMMSDGDVEMTGFGLKFTTVQSKQYF